MRPLQATSRREQLLAVGLLLAVFAHRAIRAEQPILENYVGRQVPTAMVARNLARGSGFLDPQLDTGPFPNLFLVEPPIARRARRLARVGVRIFRSTRPAASSRPRPRRSRRGASSG